MAMVASNSMNDLSNPDYSPFANLSERIARKHKSRPLESTDPKPIMIECDMDGPLTVTKGSVMCNFCGSCIRRNYLTNHRSSGACARLAEKREQQIMKNNRLAHLPQTVYRGPYVRLTDSSDDSSNQIINRNNVV